PSGSFRRTRDLLIGTSAGRQKTVLQKQDRFAFPSDAAIWRHSPTAVHMSKSCAKGKPFALGFLRGKGEGVARVISYGIVRVQRGIRLGLSRSLMAKRGGYWWTEGVQRKRLSRASSSGKHRALTYPRIETARCGHLRARVLKVFSLLRFFVALDKEMTRCHAQWLTVIKKLGNSGRSLTPKAATRH
ncbi:MAG: hypothetical protein CBARDMAM_5325, partial [uncultured Caballeronia sp.]